MAKGGPLNVRYKRFKNEIFDSYKNGHFAYKDCLKGRQFKTTDHK